MFERKAPVAVCRPCATPVRHALEIVTGEIRGRGDFDKTIRHRATHSTRFDKANRKFEDTTRYMAANPINVNDRDVETHLGGISEDEALRGAAGSDLDTEEPLVTTGKTRRQTRKRRAKKSGNSRAKRKS